MPGKSGLVKVGAVLPGVGRAAHTHLVETHIVFNLMNRDQVFFMTHRDLLQRDLRDF